MLPADGLQRPETIRDIDRFMANFPKIARTVPAEDLENVVCPSRASEPRDGNIRGGFVPIIHRVDEGLFCFVARRHCRFIDFAQLPVPFLFICGLRPFKLVDRPKNWQPAIGFG